MQTSKKAPLSLVDQFKAARRVSTPILALRTPDPSATIATLKKALNGKVPPLLEWDMVRGLQPIVDPSKEPKDDPSILAYELITEGDESIGFDPIETLVRMKKRMPERAIVFWHNAHRAVGEGTPQGPTPQIVQAMWNLRDDFKSNFRQLVLLAPDLILPAELRNDVLVLDEALPDDAALSELVKGVYLGAAQAAPDDEMIRQAVNATVGLAAFPAEQVLAMSMTKTGLEIPRVWERKCQVIEQTPGLSVWRGGETFSDVAGVDNIKSFLTRLSKGPDAPQVVVFLDEIEKAIGNAGGDTSGVKADQLGSLLTWMQDHNALGVIAVGPPGTAKSMIAKAAGNEMGGLTLAMDLGGMKGSLVGESEQRLRGALKVIEATARGRVLFFATCNSIAVLPPELRRRFTLGTFFLDLPTFPERCAIWELYSEKYGIEVSPLGFDDAGWTGAEIKQCCELAYRLKSTLAEASELVVPVSKSASDQLERLRSEASGRFISASVPGIYRYERHAQSNPSATQNSPVRALELED